MNGERVFSIWNPTVFARYFVQEVLDCVIVPGSIAALPTAYIRISSPKESTAITFFTFILSIDDPGTSHLSHVHLGSKSSDFATFHQMTKKSVDFRTTTYIDDHI